MATCGEQNFLQCQTPPARLDALAHVSPAQELSCAASRFKTTVLLLKVMPCNEEHHRKLFAGKQLGFYLMK